ncbi:type II toxin-antitoxin system Phd/YefM family antitoxin [Knoellia sp. CPCC 206453]|uniref:type II toxin-antitoxin system Phd/YefM family antitoxin n=1 Tax=Knoellia pratensis TaxID=3404796 RepID=UPI00360D48DB
MTTMNIYEAKTSFSKLIAAAEAGETVVIARNGKPVAQLGPVAPHRPVVFGDLKGKITIPDDFDQWTDEDESDWFGG